MTPISLLDFLRLGAFGPCTPTVHCTPEDVFLALGAPEEAYAPATWTAPMSRATRAASR